MIKAKSRVAEPESQGVGVLPINDITNSDWNRENRGIS